MSDYTHLFESIATIDKNAMFDTRYWMLVARCAILDARYSILDTGYWMLDARCSILDN
jgi:hypothetical protein